MSGSEALYLDLLKRCLTQWIYADNEVEAVDPRPWLRPETLEPFHQAGLRLVQPRPFDPYGLLDEQVIFLKGWFRDTLPTCPVERVAVLRLDGDLYESTTDALTYLYPKVSPGGYVIIDDYGNVTACRQAVHDYRAHQGLGEPILAIDGAGVNWQKAG